MKRLLLLLLYVLINISLSLPKANAQIDEMCPNTGPCVDACRDIPFSSDSLNFFMCTGCPCFIEVWYSYRNLSGCCNHVCDMRIDTFRINFSGGQPSDCGFWSENNFNHLDGSTYQEILKKLLARSRISGCFADSIISVNPGTRYNVRINISACRYNYFMDNFGINKYCNPDYVPCCLIDYQLVRTVKDSHLVWKIENITNYSSDTCSNSNCDNSCYFLTHQYLLTQEIPILTEVHEDLERNFFNNISYILKIENKILKLNYNNEKEPLSEIFIYNSIGCQFKSTFIGSNSFEFDLVNCPYGLYLIICKTINQNFFFDKFIISD